MTFEICVTDKSFSIQSWYFLSLSLSANGSSRISPVFTLSNGFNRHVLPNLDNGFAFIHCFINTVVNQHDLWLGV